MLAELNFHTLVFFTKSGTMANKNLFDTFALINTWFLFFSFFFSKLELDHHHLMSIFTSMDFILLYHLVCTNLAQFITHDKG
jgi:hypothetical protein